MEKSFRTILNEHLEPAEAAPAAAFTFTPHAPDLSLSHFEFAAKRPNFSSARRPYRRETELSRARAEVLRRPRPEPILETSSLSAAARADLEWMIDHGAADLRQGLNTRRLKVAYRTLARRCHPDVDPGGHEMFLILRATYARLLQTCNSR